ncbi:MAG: hypothetical protein H6738_24750 [Alphaproteobacteria bacterium]|nr:hypothetical protein [Alphaproteobacteria bacterium]MCB9700020.1 hypothetical protein [Alphaproteobacteria bacterium]
MWIWLALVGCEQGDPVCDQYVECSRSLSEQDEAEAEAQYGRGGSCFVSGSDTCGDECAERLTLAWNQFGFAACDPRGSGLVNGGGGGSGVDPEPRSTSTTTTSPP